MKYPQLEGPGASNWKREVPGVRYSTDCAPKTISPGEMCACVRADFSSDHLERKTRARASVLCGSL